MQECILAPKPRTWYDSGHRGPLAQWQSTSLITTWFQVRILGGPPNSCARPFISWGGGVECEYSVNVARRGRLKSDIIGRMAMTNDIPRSTGDVLVIDDDAAICELIVEVLTDEGYAVRSASDAEAGLRAIEDASPAL